MIPPPFDYVRPGSVEAALDVLGEYGDEAKVLAGGHSLIPLLRFRLAAPAVLVDLGGLPELSYVREQDGGYAIGAMTRHADLARAGVPLLSHVAGLVGDPQVRHRGTLGGALAHGDPASDLANAALALGATFVVRGAEATREVAADDFFTGFLETALAPDELLVEVRVPEPAGGTAYRKSTRRGIDWATVAVAVVLGSGGGGAARVALATMGPTTMRARAVEAALASGAPPDEAAALTDRETNPPTDVVASGEYRRHLARVLTRRALAAALTPA